MGFEVHKKRENLGGKRSQASDICMMYDDGDDVGS